MSDYIVGLLPEFYWQVIFATTFFFGLLFLILVIVGGFGHDSDDMDHGGVDADHDLSLDHDLALDHDLSLDHDLALDHDLSLDHDLALDHDLSLDHDLDLDHDLSLDHDLDLDSKVTIGSNITDIPNENKMHASYKMGNIAVFLFIFGQVGLFSGSRLDDLVIALALIGGYVIAKLFALVIAKLGEETIVPVKQIQKGDIGTVVYDQITPEKSGLVSVKKRDGRETQIVAIGAYPHDTLLTKESGYIIGKRNGIYLITRGTTSIEKPKEKKKALDL